MLDGGNHLLVAETGNGKTLCAEAVTKQTLDAGGRVAYLVPSHQLVGAKEDELNEWAEGEYDVRPGGYRDADVAVATFDSFYQAMLRDTGDVRALDLVVLDDFHII
ncbi:DEAD/DEAH box helicase [Halorussus sp. AFM4]|uniref:DEAD/DEAH box helicase n=1 Tax=Halorussus sp. AFM4 TaxID=3421651 RepID=UPI003EBBA1DB